MLPFNLAPRLDTVSRGQQGIPFRSTNGTAAPGEVWAAVRQTGPRRAAPMVFVVRCICHAPPARGVFQAAVGSGCHSSTAPPPPWRGWRVPQGSPASPWEGVSKFHYPPRCRRARPATAGSKVRVDRSVRSLFTSSELPSWRRAFCRYSRGFCAWNTVYSVVGGRDLSLLTYQAGYKHNSQAASANFQKNFECFYNLERP